MPSDIQAHTPIVPWIEMEKAGYRSKYNQEARYVYMSTSHLRALRDQEGIQEPEGMQGILGMSIVIDEGAREPYVSGELRLVMNNPLPGDMVEKLKEEMAHMPLIPAGAFEPRYIPALRPMVEKFAEGMEWKMRGHDHDRGEGYKQAHPIELLRWLHYYIEKLQGAVRKPQSPKNNTEIRNQCYNVGNIAAMIAETKGNMLGAKTDGLAPFNLVDDRDPEDPEC